MKKISEILDPYERLGVSKNSSKEEIKKAYRKLAMEYHPDMHPESDELFYRKEFQSIGETYEFVNSSGKEYTGEKDFDYFNNLFGISKKDFVKVMEKMSKDENREVKYFAEIIKKTLGNLF